MLEFLQKCNSLLWGIGTFALILLIGGYLWIRTGFLPIRGFPRAIKLLLKPEKGSGISGTAALCTSLAASLGTGNIIGVAAAMSVGGPGALFWMEISALLGMGLKYAEGYLGVAYRKRKPGGGWIGGPFYYLEGTGKKRLARLYAWACGIACLLSLGTTSQINGIVGAAGDFFQPGKQGIPLSGVLVGLITVAAAALVLAGGIRRIAAYSLKAVPLMAGIYSALCLWLLIRNAAALPEAIRLILQSAFRPQAALGGGMGYSLARVMQVGLGRGIFSHEAGMGSEAIAAASATDTTPEKQGLLAMLSPFFDTILVSTLTGLAIAVTGAWNQGLEGVAIPLFAFYSLPLPRRVVSLLLTLCLIFFGFSSIIGWSYYGEQSFCYLFPGKKTEGPFRLCFLLFLTAGIFLSPAIAWELADLCCAAMTLPNLLGLLDPSAMALSLPQTIKKGAKRRKIDGMM